MPSELGMRSDFDTACNRGATEVLKMKLKRTARIPDA
jgi:hypothetical protein